MINDGQHGAFMGEQSPQHDIDNGDMGAEHDDDFALGRRGDYRTYLTFDFGDGALDQIRDQAGAWLRLHGHDAALDGSRFDSDEHHDLLVLNRESADGRDFRVRLTERGADGAWRTDLTAHVSDSEISWLTVSVRNREGRVARVPRLIRYLLDVLPLRDGAALLAPRPTLLSAHDLDTIQSILCDPDRQGLVLLAGTDRDGDVDAFAARIGRVTSLVVGQAFVAVLDPLATEQLSSDFGSSHAPQPWTVRTYYPGVDPAVEVDGLRHRYLTPRRFYESSDDELRRLLRTVARGHTALRVLPAGYARVAKALARQEDEVALARLTEVAARRADQLASQSALGPLVADPSGPAVPGAAQTDHESLRLRVDLVERLLGIPNFDEAALREALRRHAKAEADSMLAEVKRQVDDQRAKTEQLQSERDNYRAALDEASLDQAVADEARRKAEETERWLRKRLEEMNDPIGAWLQVPVEEQASSPESFDELVHRVSEFAAAGVIFTGNPMHARNLDDHDTLGSAVHSAWEVFGVLADYVRARGNKRWDQGVHGYLMNGPSGYRRYPAKPHAPIESKVTMDRYGGLRVFPVPTSVDPRGQATMVAHFKLSRIGMVSPRLYYLDNYAKDGRVYVGYIGPHLPNTQTN